MICQSIQTSKWSPNYLRAPVGNLMFLCFVFFGFFFFLGTESLLFQQNPWLHKDLWQYKKDKNMDNRTGVWFVDKTSSRKDSHLSFTSLGLFRIKLVWFLTSVSSEFTSEIVCTPSNCIHYMLGVSSNLLRMSYSSERLVYPLKRIFFSFKVPGESQSQLSFHR